MILIIAQTFVNLSPGVEQPEKRLRCLAAKRPSWLKTEDGCGILGLEDSVKGRRLSVRRLEDQARQGVNAPVLPEDQSLQSTLRRGWYWGSEQFREFLLKKVDAAAIGLICRMHHL
jgi:hypothetical protein